MDIDSHASTKTSVQRQLHSLEGFLRGRSDELSWDAIARVVSHAVNQAQLKSAMLHRSDLFIFDSAVEHIKKDIDDLVESKDDLSPRRPGAVRVGGKSTAEKSGNEGSDSSDVEPATPESAFEPIRRFAEEVAGETDHEQTQALLEVQNSWKEVEQYQLKTARKFDFDKAASPRIGTWNAGSPSRETSPRFSRGTPTRRHMGRPSVGSSRSNSTENSPVSGEAGPFNSSLSASPQTDGGFSFRKVSGFAN